MNHAGIRRAAATLAALLVGTLTVGNALSAARTAGSFVGGGSQTRPGGVVTDASGGYYDAARSVYVPGSDAVGVAAARGAMTAALRARSAALNQRYGLGSYALGTPTLSAGGGGPRGFSWRDASVGASIGAALVLGLAAAALGAARWRRRPAI